MPASISSSARIVSQRRGTAPARSSSSRASAPRRGMLFHAPSFSIGLVLGAAIVLTTGYLPELLAPPSDPPKAAGSRPGTPEPASPGVTFEFDTLLRRPTTPIAAGLPEAGQPPGALAGGATPGAAPGDPAATTPPALVGEIENATPGVIEDDLPPVTDSAPVAAGPTATASSQPLIAASTPVGVVESGAAAQPPAETGPAPEPAAAPEAAAYMLQAASFRTRADADRLRAELLLLDLPASTGEVSVDNSIWYRVTIGPFADPQTADVAKERLRERNLTAIPFRR